MRRVLSILTVAAVAFPAYVASAAPHDVSAGRSWVNHDKDAWGGSAGQTTAASLNNPQGCDPIDPAQCMLPYPNDWFTKADPTSATGRRLNLNPLAMPRNISGAPIDPTPWNASDGFSAGSEILTVVPGMTRNGDLSKSRLPTDTNLAVNDASNLGVVLIDATTGRQWPVWVEIDQYTKEAGVLPAGTTSPVQQDLMIHPAINLLDGHRYVVGLRHLVTDNGSLAKQSPAFASYVQDFRKATDPDPRAAHMYGVFADLKEAGWTISSNPKDLFLAWDFTTASSQSVAGRMLAIRDDAFEQLGETKAQIDAGKLAGRAPSFTVSSVTNYTLKQNPNVAREIDGTFSVPCYIAPTCSPQIKCEQIPMSPFDDCPSPGVFQYADPTNPDSEPVQVAGQNYDADFTCVVGRTGFHSGQMYRPVEYGHGLFGGRGEVRSSPQEEMANREGMMYCAVNWFGFANADVPNAVLALSNLSLFPILADRTEQGELNFLYLQRLMISPTGFASNPAFKRGGKTFINLHDGVYYDGNSQGGIYGGTVCAISIDVRRCSLGVLGMDYPLLLPRSVDYVADNSLTEVVTSDGIQIVKDPASGTDPGNIYGSIGYSNILDTFYPDQSQRQLLLDILSTLWDRDDPDGYAGHMTASSVGGLLPDCTGLGVVPVSKVHSKCPLATPDHHVLLQPAWGDHQVANITAFDEARTIGARAVGLPATSNAIGSGDALMASRLCSHEPKNNAANDPVDGNYCWQASSVFWHIKPITSYPYDGSAITLFDGGPDNPNLPFATDPPPPSDIPQPDSATNHDPHEGPRRACAAQDQKGAFFHLTRGWVTEPKQQFTDGHKPAGPPYFSGGWNGACALP